MVGVQRADAASAPWGTQRTGPVPVRAGFRSGGRGPRGAQPALGGTGTGGGGTAPRAAAGGPSRSCPARPPPGR